MPCTNVERGNVVKIKVVESYREPGAVLALDVCSVGMRANFPRWREQPRGMHFTAFVRSRGVCNHPLVPIILY